MLLVGPIHIVFNDMFFLILSIGFPDPLPPTMAVPKVSCFNCPNRDCSILKHCDKHWLGFINDNKVITQYNKGQQIIFENTPFAGIYFVLSGKVKLFKTGSTGKQQIIRLLSLGDIFGHRGIATNIYPVSATATEDSNICYLSKECFEETLLGNAELTFNLMTFYARELNNSETEARNLAQLSVRERVADAILKIHKCYNGSPVNLSRQDMADLAGTTKEQVSKYLSDFKNERIIDLNGKSISIIKMYKLAHLAGYNHLS